MRHRFEFNDYLAGNQQINPLSFDYMPFIIDVYFNLPLKRNISES